jgi:bisphosphoglycerate-independent phosphoglycerate mutase (AlkP superfamily)
MYKTQYDEKMPMSRVPIPPEKLKNTFGEVCVRSYPAANAETEKYRM